MLYVVQKEDAGVAKLLAVDSMSTRMLQNRGEQDLPLNLMKAKTRIIAIETISQMKQIRVAHRIDGEYGYMACVRNNIMPDDNSSDKSWRTKQGTHFALTK